MILKQQGIFLESYVEERENKNNIPNPKSLADFDFFSKSLPNDINDIVTSYAQSEDDHFNQQLIDFDFFSKSLPGAINDIVTSYTQSEEEQINKQLVDFFSNYLPNGFFEKSKINSIPLPKFVRVFNMHVKKIHVCRIGKLTARVYFDSNTWDDGCILTSTNLPMIKTSIKKITLNLDNMSIIQMGWKKRF
jgi:hypothetical protein